MSHPEIPKNALEIKFHYGQTKGKFHIWPVRGGRFQWQALSNCGETATKEEAIRQAREWIMLNYNPHR